MRATAPGPAGKSRPHSKEWLPRIHRFPAPKAGRQHRPWEVRPPAQRLSRVAEQRNTYRHFWTGWRQENRCSAGAGRSSVPMWCSLATSCPNALMPPGAGPRFTTSLVVSGFQLGRWLRFPGWSPGSQAGGHHQHRQHPVRLPGRGRNRGRAGENSPPPARCPRRINRAGAACLLRGPADRW